MIDGHDAIPIAQGEDQIAPVERPRGFPWTISSTARCPRPHSGSDAHRASTHGIETDIRNANRWLPACFGSSNGRQDGGATALSSRPQGGFPCRAQLWHSARTVTRKRKHAVGGRAKRADRPVCKTRQPLCWVVTIDSLPIVMHSVRRALESVRRQSVGPMFSPACVVRRNPYSCLQPNGRRHNERAYFLALQSCWQFQRASCC